jgi:2-phosphoglycerate kinase
VRDDFIGCDIEGERLDDGGESRVTVRVAGILPYTQRSLRSVQPIVTAPLEAGQHQDVEQFRSSRCSKPYAPQMTSASAVGIPDLVFVGGAPGVGKTNVARPIAAHLGMSLTHVDDVYLVLERMTDPVQFPAIHEWRLHPDRVLALDVAGMLEHTKEVSAIVAQAITPVIADRLESGIRTVFEGDFIQPAFAASETFDGVPTGGRVRSLFVHDTLEQFAVNILAREGEEQPRRAEITWNYSEWLRAECERLGVPSISARPWKTATERALDAISAATNMSG